MAISPSQRILSSIWPEKYPAIARAAAVEALPEITQLSEDQRFDLARDIVENIGADISHIAEEGLSDSLKSQLKIVQLMINQKMARQVPISDGAFADIIEYCVA